MKIGDGRGVSAGARPISWRRLAMLFLALCALLFDFGSPLTPTPIAVVHGKADQRPFVAAAIVIPAAAPAIVVPLVQEVFAFLANHWADPLDLNSRRRC